MGVINLGLLVEKIKRKLEGSGFVKNTDYATSTTGGVIKTSSTYGTAVTSGALKGATKTATQYESASDDMFVSKGTLDNLIAAGAIGGGMTWTKIYEGAGAASSSHDFASGVDALGHKLAIITTYNNDGRIGTAFGLTEIVPAATNTATLALNRDNETLTITLARTSFTMPSNAGADNVIIYVLD